MTRYYYSRDGSDVQGPILESDLQGMRSAGLLNETTQICEEGSETWQPITFIKGGSAKCPLVQPGRDPDGGKYVCPQCGSRNIQSVPLLYEAGTSTSISKGRVIGVAGLGTDHLTPAGGMTTTTHRQQTLLAARYSPPRPQTASNDATALLFIAVCALIIVGILLLTVDSESSHSIVAVLLILGGVATFIPAIKALKAMQAKQKQLTSAYVEKLKEWHQSFVCQKCGYFATLREKSDEMPQTLTRRSFTVVLRSVGNNKIGAIRIVRSIRPELGLADAKQFVESVPQILVEGISEPTARQIADAFTEIDVSVELVSSDGPTS